MRIFLKPIKTKIIIFIIALILVLIFVGITSYFFDRWLRYCFIPKEEEVNKTFGAHQTCYWIWQNYPVEKSVGGGF